jgi:hypothetical protein
MTDLSPATSAILDAYWEAFNAPLEGAVHRPLAAALRAAADQVVPEEANAVGDEHDNALHDQWMRIRYKLLAIAAELKRQ